VAAKRKRNPPSPFVARAATERQSEFLVAIRELTAELQRAPNATEVGERLGIVRDGARKQLQALAAKGIVADVPKMVSSGQWAIVER